MERFIYGFWPDIYMKKGLIFVGLLMIIGLLSTVSVSASYFNYWGVGPSYYSNSYSYSGYGNYGGCGGYYGHYNFCRSRSYGYDNSANVMRYGRDATKDTYDFMSNDNNFYEFDSNSRDYNAWDNYNFQGNPSRSYFWD
jgi:hypothetical protein